MKSRAAWAVLRVNLTVLARVLSALAIVLLMLSTAKAQRPHTDQQREAYIDVGVATLWVEPRTDRRIDRPAVSDPSNVRLWQRSMTLRQKR